MKSAWQTFLTWLTPGVRMILLCLAVTAALALAGKWTHTCDVSGWLTASAHGFWHGQIWRIFSYALVPRSLSDLAMSALGFIVIGSQLERHWSRGELWWFCAVTAAGGGLMNVSLSAAPLVGAAPVTFGLLVAWGWISGSEEVLAPLAGRVTVRQLVLVLAGAGLLVTFFSAGLTPALVTAFAGFSGWAYLWLQRKRLMSRSAHSFRSERINRLEF
jgi:membrane associated rhomboid family serine protease